MNYHRTCIAVDTINRCRTRATYVTVTINHVGWRAQTLILTNRRRIKKKSDQPLSTATTNHRWTRTTRDSYNQQSSDPPIYVAPAFCPPVHPIASGVATINTAVAAVRLLPHNFHGTDTSEKRILTTYEVRIATALSHAISDSLRSYDEVVGREKLRGGKELHERRRHSVSASSFLSLLALLAQRCLRLFPSFESGPVQARRERDKRDETRRDETSRDRRESDIERKEREKERKREKTRVSET